jgi:DNA (cytosine-5)-methyltransferase 1
LVAHSLRAEGFDASEDGTGRGTPMVPVLSSGQANAELCDNLSPALNCNRDGSPIIGQPVALHYTHDYCQDRIYAPDGPSPALNTAQHHTIAFHNRQDPDVSGDVTHPTVRPTEVAQPLTTVQAGNHNQGGDFVQQSMAVRRLTPVECERLQGFPDNFTRIPWRGKDPENCPDGPRYKALGNSFAANVVEWIGQRIQIVEGIQ